MPDALAAACTPAPPAPTQCPAAHTRRRPGRTPRTPVPATVTTPRPAEGSPASPGPAPAPPSAPRCFRRRLPAQSRTRQRTPPPPLRFVAAAAQRLPLASVPRHLGAAPPAPAAPPRQNHSPLGRPPKATARHWTTLPCPPSATRSGRSAATRPPAAPPSPRPPSPTPTTSPARAAPPPAPAEGCTAWGWTYRGTCAAAATGRRLAFTLPPRRPIASPWPPRRKRPSRPLRETALVAPAAAPPAVAAAPPASPAIRPPVHAPARHRCASPC